MILFPSNYVYLVLNLSSFCAVGCEKGHEGDLQGACQEPQEEGGRRRWQGQEEEVVQGKDQGQVEQLGALRQGHIRQAA